ncbi:hypothetical protein H7X87_00285 [Acetobacteraceae bacterium]|nr:hypothetical protein [Candidatus Parcubacteria bacterium]
MKVSPKKLDASQVQISLSDFLKSYNKTIPQGFPHASATLLKKFKDEHTSFFKHGESWSLDEHRKKIMDWLPLNGGVSE